jgi:hypothetical protein
MRPDDSKDVVDRALKRLPTPHAPHTLLPRVMSAVESRVARAAPKPWVDWPLGWQLASAALVVVFAIAVVRLGPGAEAAIGRSAAPVIASVTSQLGDLADRTLVAVTLTRVIWRALMQLSGYALLLVLMMGAACATFGAALDRVALGGHT